MAAAVHIEDFLAVEADLHRAAEQDRRLRHHDLVVVQIALAAEAAAVRAGDHAHVRGRNLQRIGEGAMDIVRHLRGRPERELAFAIHRRDRGVLLDWQMRIALVEEQILENVVGLGERFVHVAELEGLKAVDIALLAVALDARLGRRERLLGIGDGLERLVLDVDEIERLERGLLVAGDHRGDRVAHVAHALRRERVLVLRHRQDPEGDRKILAGEHEVHARACLRARHVDRFDRRVRMRRAQQLAMQHARQHHVVGEAREARHLGAAVHAAARLADHVETFPGRHILLQSPVIPSAAKNLLLRSKNRSFASFRMTA